MLIRICIVVLVMLAGLHAQAQAQAQASVLDEKSLGQLQRKALSSDLAWELLASLTSEVGPRMAGSEGDERAVAWAVDRMNSLGFDRVWTEPVSFPRWVRRYERAEVILPSRQPLVITALGGSPATPGPVVAEIVQFDTLEALEAADSANVQGKIVFLSTRMAPSREGTGYGKTVVNRSQGPFVAASKDGVALLIRSVGTDSDRLPHTGNISSSEPGERVPSAALSNPDADNLMLMLKNHPVVKVRLELDVGFDGEASSHNGIGEFDGRDDNGEFVLAGAHLDSWDLGTGAIDDGAGVAIIMAASRLVAELPVRPRRGIRVVLYANEEQGIFGGKAYAKKHAGALEKHVIGAESDLGADRIYSFRTRTLETAEPALDRLAGFLEKLGIERDASEPANGGADVGQMRKIGMPVIDLRQDATRYFELHHTANDTLDKVDPYMLGQNVAAWVTFLHVMADSTTVFGPVEPSE